MVLMSFFIMFFNIDSKNQKKQNEIMDQLTNAFTTAGMGGFGKKKTSTSNARGVETGGSRTGGIDKGDGKGPGKGGNEAAMAEVLANTPPAVIKELVKEVMKRDPHLRVSQSPLDPRGVAIDLPDDIYRIGEYHADWRVMGELDRVIRLIRPFQKEIRLIFVGHTDPLPIAPNGRNQVVASNLVLSDCPRHDAEMDALDRAGRTGDHLHKYVDKHGSSHLARKCGRRRNHDRGQNQQRDTPL
jgi:hypothetical protein